MSRTRRRWRPMAATAATVARTALYRAAEEFDRREAERLAHRQNQDAAPPASERGDPIV